MLRMPSWTLSFSFVICLTAWIALAQQPRIVNDALLLEAPADEWLTYGRDYAETHYSPLKQINSGNVKGLGLGWSWPTGSQGRLETTPLVSNGILYGTLSWSVVFALDARTGELLWQWDPAIVRSGGPSLCCGPGNRGVALYQGKVYVGLLDGRLVALDAKTGKVHWAAQTTPPGDDYSITGAPRAFKGKVIVGNAGAEFGVRGYTSAYDAETGKLVWRTYHVPGDPSKPFESPAMEHAAKTWTGEWWKMGGGGTAWDSYSYDPEAGLVYVGTGNGSPWNYEHRSPGGGDNLYLASILALRIDTGEQVWYYQTTPRDSWDFTATMNMILTDLTIDGRQRKVLMQAPKNGFFYVLDRLTGELISAEPITEITWATHVDKKTGRPVETPQAHYDTKGTILYPGPAGSHNWYPMSWNPATGLVYIPGQNAGFYFAKEPDFQYQKGRTNWGVLRRPPEGAPRPTREGFLLAWDPVSQKERWRIPIETAMNGGTLTTAGNLVFSGVAAGGLVAHSADKGEKLWEVKLSGGMATPITYDLDGRQYITVVSGSGGSAGPGMVWTFVLDGNAPMPVLQTP